ncbi:MAG TPA: hypothetical protein VGS06_09260 [Streptosporangiaceae bacterium]|nr:hypothetical protein [Streptosporangiaceae bacterium]
MGSNAPRWSSDVHQADWIAARLAPREDEYTITVVVPAGFEAYARSGFRSDLDRKLSGVVNSRERLTCYVLAVHQWAQRRAHHPRGKRKLSSQMLAVVHEPLEELRELLAAILADGIANGTFASELDPALHAQLILNMITDPRVTTPTAPQQLLGFIQRGLSPQDSHPH